MRKPIAVLAGTYAEYRDWLAAHRLQWHDAHFIGSAHFMGGADDIRGMEFSRVETIGTWRDLPNAEELLAAVKARIR